MQRIGTTLPIHTVYMLTLLPDLVFHELCKIEEVVTCYLVGVEPQSTLTQRVDDEFPLKVKEGDGVVGVFVRCSVLSH